LGFQNILCNGSGIASSAVLFGHLVDRSIPVGGQR